ncbi:MAG: phenylalanine--tRNA ligase subunit beta [Desulfomonile tiedjei]|nr:phenylalanine--tRNA ligase subunit beta [Desulfomonile tiedjei]
MLVSLNWLKEFVEIDLSAEEVADLLTMGGIEVDSVTHVGEGLDGVYTASIVEISPHPSAEKLSLARISLGDRAVVVVCGAPNIQVGQIVPYAAPGAKLPSGLVMEERAIKGVVSPGMICSEKELGLGEDAAGILAFSSGTPVGLPLAEALPFIKDAILETSVTPNRGDCLSVVGIAREVAALSGKPLGVPDVALSRGSIPVSEKCRIDVPDADLCPRYVATMVEGLRIGPSPFEVRLRVSRSGVRPISNVVDVTNLICIEFGQPLHAFDYSLLEEGRIVVRRSEPGETFVTLDGVERQLPENALMIRDGKRAVALAGIMGGLNSEISDATTTVLIESACFERFGIRRTAKALGMGTEASFRMERGVDPEETARAAHRAAQLIQKLAGGTLLDGHVDVYEAPIVRQPLPVRPAKVNSLLGISLTAMQMASYLERLGISCEMTNDAEETLTVTPPSWRWDLERDVDAAEEVARVHGFQNIPISTPQYRSAADNTRKDHDRVRAANGLMNAAGFTEVINMSFVSAAQAREFPWRNAEAGSLPLMNPLTEDYAVMRTSLLPGLLSTLKRNMSFRLDDLKIYEVGRTFSPVAGADLPQEELRLAGLAVGARHAQLWNVVREEIIDFYDVKGALETLFEGFNVTDVAFVPSNLAFLHPGKSADLVLDGAVIGFLGELTPSKIREHDLSGNPYIFEILLEPLFIRSRKETVFRPIPRYPYIERDLSIIVEEKCSGEKIKQLISRLGHDIIASVVLFDIYRGESIPEGYQSVAFRIRYQSEERTLTDEEVQAIHSRVVTALQAELGAMMRE